MTSNAVREYRLFEVFYRRAGEKKSRLFTSKVQAHRFRDFLKANRRKFLGQREVTLYELED